MTDKKFSVGAMVRFEGTYLLEAGTQKQMVMDTVPRTGVIIEIIDLDALGLKHQLIRIFSENEVCVVRTEMEDTFVELV